MATTISTETKRIQRKPDAVAEQGSSLVDGATKFLQHAGNKLNVDLALIQLGVANKQTIERYAHLGRHDYTDLAELIERESAEKQQKETYHLVVSFLTQFIKRGYTIDNNVVELCVSIVPGRVRIWAAIDETSQDANGLEAALLHAASRANVLMSGSAVKLDIMVVDAEDGYVVPSDFETLWDARDAYQAKLDSVDG